jgi:hypothetical protein
VTLFLVPNVPILIFCRSRFSDIFFIDATSEENLVTDLKNIALAKQIGDSAEDTLLWLRGQHKEWLIVFDNADDTTLDLRKHFPHCLHGNILITSRNRHAREFGTTSDFDVSRLNSHDARDVLLGVMRLKETPTLVSEELIETLLKVQWANWIKVVRC